MPRKTTTTAKEDVGVFEGCDKTSDDDDGDGVFWWWQTVGEATERDDPRGDDDDGDDDDRTGGVRTPRVCVWDLRALRTTRGDDE